MKQSVTRQMRVRMWTAVGRRRARRRRRSPSPQPPMAQAQPKPFELVDATIEDVHAEYKAGRLTARALVQRLPRSHRGLRQERPEDQLGHHHQSEGARRSRRARRRLQEVRAGRAAARHPGRPEGSDGRRRHADDARLGRAQGLRADARRVRHGQAEEGRRDHPGESDAGRVGRRRFLRLALRRDTQPLRPGAHRRRILGRHRAPRWRPTSPRIGVGQEGFASIRRPSTWNSIVGMRPTPAGEPGGRVGRLAVAPRLARADGAHRHRPGEAARRHGRLRPRRSGDRARRRACRRRPTRSSSTRTA